MKYATFILAASFMLHSCSEDNVQFKIDALTTGSWKLTAYVTDYNKDGWFEENTFLILADCEKDNIYTYQADGYMIADEGPSSCIDNEPQITTENWSFNEDQNQLRVGTTNFEIEELTKEILTLKTNVLYNGIFTIDVKSTYQKQ